MFQLGRMELGPRESQPCHRAFHHILGYRQADLPQGALAELPGAGVVSAHHPRHHVRRLSLRSRRREDETRREQKWQGAAWVHIRPLLLLPPAPDHPRGLLVSVQQQLLQQHPVNFTLCCCGHSHQLPSDRCPAPGCVWCWPGLHTGHDSDTNIPLRQPHLSSRPGTRSKNI